MKGQNFAYTHFVGNSMQIHRVYFFVISIEQIYKFLKFLRLLQVLNKESVEALQNDLHPMH
jgi:hypothetical protein